MASKQNLKIFVSFPISPNRFPRNFAFPKIKVGLGEMVIKIYTSAWTRIIGIMRVTLTLLIIVVDSWNHDRYVCNYNHLDKMLQLSETFE